MTRRHGIGSALVTQGVEQLRETGCDLVVVFGHAGFYKKFGFSPASRHGFACQWEGVPDEDFMVKFLKGGSDGIVRGTVRYLQEFDAAAEQPEGATGRPA